MKTLLNNKDQIAFESAIGSIFKKYKNKKDPVIIKKRVNETIFLLSLFIISLTQLSNPLLMGFVWVQVCIWTLLGFCLYVIGTRVMHVYIHGVGTSDSKLNKTIGAIALFLCTGSVIWRLVWDKKRRRIRFEIRGVFWDIQHNMLHHSLPNMHGIDPDINGAGIIRIHKEEAWRPWHILQPITAWPVYSIMTLYWVTFKDYVQFAQFSKHKAFKKYFFKYSLLSLLVAKMLHLFFWIVLPILLLDSHNPVISNFAVMHLCVGVALAVTFQIGHRTDKTDTMTPVDQKNPRGEIKNFEYQLRTTSNFALNSRFITWITGELNYQVEHHLFPTIDPAFYKEASKEVQEVAKEFGIPYFNEKTLLHGLHSHIRLLIELSKKPRIT